MVVQADRGLDSVLPVCNNCHMTGNKIKLIRCTLKLSQADLADIIKSNRITISRWENDRNKPTGAYLRALENLFKTIKSEKFSFGEFCLICNEECPDPVTYLDWFIFNNFSNGEKNLPILCPTCKNSILKIRKSYEFNHIGTGGLKHVRLMQYKAKSKSLYAPRAD